MKLNSNKFALVVEDKEHVAKTLCKYLESCGYQTRCAPNGMRALETLAEMKKELCQVEVIISDVMMPQMDGFALLQMVKTKPEYQNTLFLLITGTANSRDSQSAKAQGADGYLTKPVTLEQIQSFLKTKLKKNAA